MNATFAKIKKETSELSSGEIVEVIGSKLSESNTTYYHVRTINDVELLVRDSHLNLIPNKKLFLLLSMTY